MTEVFSLADFMPHGHCYYWLPSMVWLQVGSNLLIGLAYISISLSLFYIVRKVSPLPFTYVYLAFGLFIVVCGLTHLMDVVNIWLPYYWIDAGLRVVTAIVSMATAIMLPRLIPKAVALSQGTLMALRNGVKLETAYKELGSVYQKMQELDETKTRFFANVSHELRTPLALIMGPLAKILDRMDFAGEDKQDLEIIQRNAGLLLKRVNDLLSLIKLDSHKPLVQYSVVNLPRAIQQLVSHFEIVIAERKIKFRIETPDVLYVEADSEMLQQIVLNLLSNAFKFTPTGGRIDIELVGSDSAVEIRVTDSGVGIPDEQKSEVFERFTQFDKERARPFGSSGLGLAIAKEYVELHGGHIRVEDANPDGAGSSFVVLLPRKAPPGTTPQMGSMPFNKRITELAVAESRKLTFADSAPSGIRNGERPLILIVEDNLDMTNFVRRLFERDYEVLVASDGEMGLQMALEHQPDLILTDVMLPGFSGAELVKKLHERSETANIPVIALTAKTDDQLRLNLLENGAQDFILKPFYPEEVLARVRNILALTATRRTLQKDLSLQMNDLEKLAKEITARKRALQEAVKARDEFLSVASHELRTPITALKLQIQVARRGIQSTGNSEAMDSFYEVCLRQVNALARLVDELLDVARIQSGRMHYTWTKVNLSELVKEVVTRYTPQLRSVGSSVYLNIEPDCWGTWDPVRMEQVFANLISNAAKYAPGGELKISVVRQDEILRVVVEDNGPGIPHERQANIFDRFERASNSKFIGGLGLGLFIAKNIVEAHEGKITLHSELGRGTRFTIELPTNLSDRSWGGDKDEWQKNSHN